MHRLLLITAFAPKLQVIFVAQSNIFSDFCSNTSLKQSLVEGIEVVEQRWRELKWIRRETREYGSKVEFIENQEAC